MVSMDKCMSVCLLLGPPLARGYCIAEHNRQASALPTVVRSPLFGLILMADFAQGLDASKLILAETVRFFQLLRYL
jgi:hypothetical protein